MMLASLRERFSARLEWIATQIAARPKGVLVLWTISLVAVALVV